MTEEYREMRRARLVRMVSGMVMISLPLAIGCKDDDPVGEACAATADAIVEYCVPGNRDHESRVFTALVNTCGFDYMASDLQSADALESLCLDELDGADVSGEDVDQFKAWLSADGSCNAVMNDVSLACDELF